MNKIMEFKARFWNNDTKSYKKKITDTYYCSGESENPNAPLCLNTEEGQFILDTNSIIKLLKKHGRI